MVNSTKESNAMNADRDPQERVSAVERKVDALAEAVATGFAEQRAYTDSAYDQINGRFAQIDGRFAQIDGRFGQMDARFDRLERKLDGFIETQSRFNQIAERRFERLEQFHPAKRIKRR